MNAAVSMFDAVTVRHRWPMRPLGKVVTFLGGGTPSKQRDDFWGGDIPWVSPKDMKSDVVVESIDSITPAGVGGSAVKIIPVGALLVVVRSGILARTVPIALAGVELTINQDLKALVPAPSLDAHFLAYFMRSAESRLLAAVSRGATVHRLETDALKSLTIPVPPLDEQKRLVAVLDQAFAALDRARALAEANLVDAENLFEESLSEVLTKHATAGNKTTLGKICAFENGDRGKNYPGRKAFVSEGVPFINAGHLDNGAIAWEDMNFIPEAHFHRLSKGKVQKDDLLFCLRGSLGKFGRVDREGLGAIASSLVIVRPGADTLIEFIAMYFKSKLCKLMIEHYAGGAAQPNLSAGDLKKFEIVLPPLSSQCSAVREHDLLLEGTSKLVELYRKRLDDLAALRQSLLQKAFSGELT